MWRVLCTFLAASALLLAGCLPTLYTDAPLGDPAVLEPSEWDGLWICDTELRRVWTVDPDFNGPSLTKNWRDCNAEPADREELNVKLRQHGEWLFEGKCDGRLATGEPCRYSFVARRVGAMVTIYEADETRIRRLFDQGKVPGRIEFIEPRWSFFSEKPREPEQRVVLHSLTADHYKVLLDPEEGAFRPWIEYQCIRLPAELDPCQQAK